MKIWTKKLKLRLPAILLLVVTLLFWGLYDRYQQVGPVLLESPTLADSLVHYGDCAEFDGRFILTVPDGGKSAVLRFRLPDDAVNYSQIRVRGRMKLTDVVEGKRPWQCGRLLLTQYDTNNKWMPGVHSIAGEKNTTQWKWQENELDVFPGAEYICIALEQLGVSGTAEFESVSAYPVEMRGSFVWWRSVFLLLWGGMFVSYFSRCRLHSRRLRVLILLNAIAILAGALMPGIWIQSTSLFVKDQIVQVVNKPSEKTNSSAGAKEVKATPIKKVATSTGDQLKREATLMDQFNLVVGNTHKIGHYLLFASLSFLVYCSAALERQGRGYFIKVAFDILLFAAITEALQHLTMDRSAGFSDWLVDAAGMLTAFLFFLISVKLFRVN